MRVRDGELVFHAEMTDAIARIGFNEVRNIVVTTGVIDAFSAAECPFDYMGFWKPCLTSAIAAGTLAQRSPKIDLGGSPGDNPYFVAGLMHDVGIFMLVQCQSRRYGRVLTDAVERHTTLVRSEHDKLGYTHAEVGAALIQEWGLPEGVSVAAEFHPRPTDAPEEFATWAQVIHLADWIADHEGLGVSVEGASSRFAEGTWFELGKTDYHFDLSIPAVIEGEKSVVPPRPHRRVCASTFPVAGVSSFSGSGPRAWLTNKRRPSRLNLNGGGGPARSGPPFPAACVPRPTDCS